MKIETLHKIALAFVMIGLSLAALSFGAMAVMVVIKKAMEWF